MLSASKFFLKRSYTPGSVPLSSDLGDGELAINLADKKIFFKDIEDQIHFLEISPYSFLSNLSSVLVIEGNNTVTGVFSQVLGGYNNDVSGGGSTVNNGENNDIEADFAFITNGLNNLILSGGDFGGILGGQNNTLDHQQSFILGSNITSHLSGVTYVNNLSATGKIYGDGSELIGVTGGSLKYQEITTNSVLESNKNYLLKTSFESITATLPPSPSVGDSLTFFINVSSSSASVALDLNGNKINSNSENILCDIDAFFTLIYENSNIGWNFLPFNLASIGSQTVTYLPLSTFQSLSGNWQESYTITQSNSANWQNTFTTVQSNSATNWNKSKTIAFFTVLDNEPPATNFATLDTRNSHPVLDFDTTTQEAAVFRTIIPEGLSLTNGLTVFVQWAATSATTGTVGWDVAFERIVTDGLDIDGDSFGTPQTITAATVSSTSGVTKRTSVTFTQAQLPASLTGGDMIRIRIRRDVANDNAAGDAELIGVEVRSAA